MGASVKGLDGKDAFSFPELPSFWSASGKVLRKRWNGLDGKSLIRRMRFMYLPVAPGGQGCISMLPAAVAAHDTPSRGSAGHFGASGRQRKNMSS